jgi:asparagine synthase (glutamine-hydrolysing)
MKRESRVGTMLAGNASLNRLIRPDAVSQLLTQHESGERDNHKLLFSLTVFQQWLETI